MDRKAIKFPNWIHTWIIVHQEPSSLSNLVSPQTAITCASSEVTATKRLSDSGVTVWEPSGSVGTRRKDRIESYCIGIHHEDILIESWVDSDDVAHLVVDLKLEGIHRGVKVDSVEVVEEQDLRVTLATVAWALAFTRSADFYNHHISRFV